MPLVACLLALNLVALIGIAKRLRETASGLARLRATVVEIRTEQESEVVWLTGDHALAHDDEANENPVAQSEQEGFAA